MTLSTRSLRRRPALTLLELLILLVVLGAIALYARRKFAETPTERREATLKVALRDVVSAQEEYFIRHTRYASSVQQLEVRPRKGITVRVDTASELGWRARAWADDQPSRVCSVWSGAPEGPPGTEGVPRCAVAPPDVKADTATRR